MEKMQNSHWISWKIAFKAWNMPSQDVRKFTPVSCRTSALWGRCPALTPLLQLITQSRASGTADHVRCLDDLFRVSTKQSLFFSTFLIDAFSAINPMGFYPKPFYNQFLFQKPNGSKLPFVGVSILSFVSTWSSANSLLLVLMSLVYQRLVVIGTVCH